VKSNQATVAGIKSNPKGGFDARVTYQKTLFDVDSLARFGKWCGPVRRPVRNPAPPWPCRPVREPH